MGNPAQGCTSCSGVKEPSKPPSPRPNVPQRFDIGIDRLMSQMGHTRESADVCDTTASPLKPDMPGSPNDVAEGP